MKKIVCFFIVAGLLPGMVSCKKEKDQASSASAIQGTWKFVSISAKTQSIVTSKDPDDGSIYKTITTSDYTSTDNGGTITFSNSTITTNAITYTVNFTAYSKIYMDDQFVQDNSFPFKATYPPTNSSTPYKIVGSDSMYSAGQPLVTAQNGTSSASPSGLKFAIKGNILTMTSNVLKDTIINYEGTILNQHETGVASMLLQKQ